MFEKAPAFNQDIGRWNVASVQSFSSMFSSAGATFNRNIGGWNVSSATDLRHMFSSEAKWVYSASSCTTACSSSSLTCSELSWPTSATTMSAAFYTVGQGCNPSDFSSDKGAFAPVLYRTCTQADATGACTAYRYSCYGYTASSERCSAAATSGGMRLCACVSSSTAFNQQIGGWNVARVANLYGMLHGAGGFDQNLGNWNVASVANLAAALDFASGLSFGNKRAMYMGWGSTVRTWYPTWGLVASNIASSVTWWVSAPRTAVAAYGPIGSWDTSAVTNFGSLFSSRPTFNDDISGWNVASATSMDRIFLSAAGFDRDVSRWNVGRVSSFSAAFDSVGLSNCAKTFIYSAWGITLQSAYPAWSSISIVNCTRRCAKRRLADLLMAASLRGSLAVQPDCIADSFAYAVADIQVRPRRYQCCILAPPD